MNNEINNLISLIGTSERDINLTNSLNKLGFNPIIPRPKKGDDYIHIHNQSSDIEIAFQFASTLNINSKQHADGELILTSIFFSKNQSTTDTITFPHNINFSQSRTLVRQNLGAPAGSFERGKLISDTWRFGTLNLGANYTHETYLVKLISYFVEFDS